jgi:hypothetical protein
MTLLEVLSLLHQRLVDALDQNNHNDLYLLLSTFSVLREISYQSENRRLSGILEDLEGAAQNGIIGAKGKNPVPSVKEIEAAVNNT